MVDSLAAAAVLVMGEGDEAQPVGVIRGAPVEHFSSQDTSRDLFVDPQEDLYAPLLKPFFRKNDE